MHRPFTASWLITCAPNASIARLRPAPAFQQSGDLGFARAPNIRERCEIDLSPRHMRPTAQRAALRDVITINAILARHISCPSNQLAPDKLLSNEGPLVPSSWLVQLCQYPHLRLAKRQDNVARPSQGFAHSGRNYRPKVTTLTDQ
jgi:hypothetical protein